jgi:rare lipoprotein A
VAASGKKIIFSPEPKCLRVMGFGILIWSWLSFSLPVQQQQLQVAVQKVELAKAIKSGVASYYHPRFVGRLTATGDVFSNEKFTAASNHFKLGTYVKVTNLRNGKFVYVRINDRMGQPNRIIDLTQKAAETLHFINRGLTKVKIEPVPVLEGKRQILAQNELGTTVPDNIL